MILLFPFLEQTAIYEVFTRAGNNFNQDMNRVFWGVPGYAVTTGANTSFTEDEKIKLARIPSYRCPTRRAPTGEYRVVSEDTAVDEWCVRNGPRGDYAFVCLTDEPRTGISWQHSAANIPKNISDTNFMPRVDAMLSVCRAPCRENPTGNDWVTWYPRDTFARIVDGTSNTAILGEKHISAVNLNLCNNNATTNPTDGYQQDCAYSNTWVTGSWGDGWNGRGFGWGFTTGGAGHVGLSRGPDDRIDGQPGNSSFGSWHPGICQFLFCDGAVLPVRNTISSGSMDDHGILLMLADVSDGKTLPSLD